METHTQNMPLGQMATSDKIFDYVDLDSSVENFLSSNVTFHCSAVVQLPHQRCQK